MTDLLPVVFARGQNESIDPRVAPPDVHAIAQNVRWRKDGRPAKRYGSVQISSTGLDSGGSLYTSQPVNAITSWRGTPVFILGAGVRQLTGSIWTTAASANPQHISHWAPGRHDPIARSELSLLVNASVAFSNGFLVYAWDNGTSTFFSIVTTDGAVVRAGFTLGVGTYPRCVAVGNLVYIVNKNGVNISAATFDTTTLSVTTTTGVGTLNAAGDFFDAFARTTDWLIVYQSGAATLTSQLMSGASAPAAVQTRTQATTAAPGLCTMGITGTASSNVFVVWFEPAFGKISCVVYDNAMTVLAAGPTLLDTDLANVDQPGIVTTSNSTAEIVWGGKISVSGGDFGYLRVADINNAGVATGFTQLDHQHIASKPFNGVPTGFTDGVYVWVNTHNGAYSGATNWEDQRSFYLMWISPNSTGLRRQLHTPGMVATASSNVNHINDVIRAGATTGFYTAMTNTVRTSGAATLGDNFGIDSVSFFNIFNSQRDAARATVAAGRVLQIAGGELFEYNGNSEETGFSNAPVIYSATATAGAGLSQPFSYLYVAVFEYIDAQGRRHRSAPSDPLQITTSAGNQQGTLLIAPLISFSRAALPTIHIYRTLASGTTFHRVTPSSGAPNASPGVPLTYVDSVADQFAQNSEFLYTDGGVVPNDLPPPCTFMAVCNGRVWLGGQLERNVITASKILVDSEPTQFSAEDEFSVFLAEECTGLASLDGTVIAFAREAIYLITGDGPNDQGIGSFNPPQKLPSDVGCIDWRSVVETSMGVFFQAKRGIYLLPRGFNTPLFVGAEVESTLSQFPVVVSATLVTTPSSGSGVLGESTVRFVVSSSSGTISSAVLVYDLRTQGWSVDFFSGIGLGAFGRSGTFNDAFVFTGANISTGKFANIWQETPGTYSDNGAFIGTELGTGDIRPFGLGGYGGFDSLLVVGEYRGNSFVNVAVSVDGAAPDFYSFTVQAADAPDGSVYLDVTPKVRMGSSIRVTISDTEGTPSEGFLAQALFIEHETIGKAKRLAAGRRA